MNNLGVFKVTSVSDGDTIRVSTPPMPELTTKKSLRLLNIDTEETTNPKLLGPVTQYGKEVTKLAREFFKKSDNRVVLYAENKVGFFGRPLVYVHNMDGRCYQEYAISEGWSPYYCKYGYAHGEYHQPFIKAQERAKKQKKGIWSDKMQNRIVGRPYGDLLKWWELRAEALADAYFDENFILTNSEDYSMLEGLEGQDVTVFGELSCANQDKGFFTIKVGMKKHFYVYCPSNRELQQDLVDRFISTEEDLIKNNFIKLRGTLENYKGSPEIELHDFEQVLNWDD